MPAKPLRFAGLCLALMLALGAPAGAQTTGTAQPTGEIGVEASSTEALRQDRAIAQRIRDILSELDGYNNVTVAVSAGVVTLTGRVAEPDQIRRLDELVSRVDGVVTIENEVTETTDLAERLNPAIERFKSRVFQVVAALPIILVALIVGGGVFVCGILISRARQPWKRLAPNEFIADIYRQIVRLVFLVAGIVIALDIVGATALLGTILGAAGIVGLAIGFAVRDTVENFIASVMLSIRQPFRPNDLIEIEGDIGKVIRLTSRATILLSLDGNHIRVPNATVFKSRIVNYTRNDERRFVFDIGVSPDADLDATRRLVQDTVRDLPFTLSEPSASVWIEEISVAGVVLRVTGWLLQNETNFSVARGEAIRMVKAAIEASGVEIPDTTYRVRLDNPLAVTPEAGKPPKPRAAAHHPPDRAPVSADASDTADQALERLTEAERAEADDLLTNSAPEE